MKAILEYLKSISGKKRKIAVLGDMLELGDFSKQLHEKVGEEIVKNNIYIVITVGKEIKYAANIAEKQGVKQVYAYTNNQDAVNKINEIKAKDDYIVLKASNGMKFNEIYEKIIK